MSAPYWEILAAFLGVWGVWDLGKGKRRGYVSGTVSTTLYVLLCYQNGIYADAWTNVWYSVMGIYGWRTWLVRERQNGGFVVVALNARNLGAGLGLGLGTWVLAVFLLVRYTDSTVPIWDATTTALAVLAMFWMAAGHTVHWPVWVLVNLLSVGLYFSKNMYPTAVQYFVFLILAFRGWWLWHRLDPGGGKHWWSQNP